MTKSIARIAIMLALAFCASLFIFVGGQVLTLADMAARIAPWFGDLVFWTGMGGVAAALFWLGGVYFLRPRPLELPDDPTPEELSTYLRKLETRLRTNPHLIREGLGGAATEAADDSLEALLARLDAAAIRETKRTASRIFLSTAIARNGRLDTLIVLVLLARLVWRISALYDHRPHPRALVRLYLNVAGTALAAGALEDAGLEDHIHALLTPLLAASPMTSVPGVSGLGAVLTAALVDGSANALLALRVGIVTRNVLSPVLPGSPARQSPYREAASLLGRMSGGLVRKVVKAAVSGFTSGITDRARRAADAVCKGARCTVRGVGEAARSASEAATRTGNVASDRATEAVRRGAGMLTRKKSEQPEQTTHTPGVEKSKGAAITAPAGDEDDMSRTGRGARSASRAAYRPVPLSGAEVPGNHRDDTTYDEAWERIGTVPGITSDPSPAFSSAPASPGTPTGATQGRAARPAHGVAPEGPFRPKGEREELTADTRPDNARDTVNGAGQHTRQDTAREPARFSPARRLLRSLLLKRHDG